MSKRMVHIYSTYEQMNQFGIGYIINPSLKINRVFREQVENFLRATFHENKMEIIRDAMKKKDICVIALVMFYETNRTKPKKVFRLLSCVLYYLIKNHICIDYLSCQSKTLSRISSNRISKQTSFNILLDFGIPEVLMINLELVILLTLHLKLIGCSENKLKIS